MDFFGAALGISTCITTLSGLNGKLKAYWDSLHNSVCSNAFYQTYFGPVQIYVVIS